jgi:hypothetical protein
MADRPPRDAAVGDLVDLLVLRGFPGGHDPSSVGFGREVSRARF